MRRSIMEQLPLPPDMEMLADLDPELMELALQIRRKALYTDGALPSRTKLLMAAVLDAAAGHSAGASVLFQRAMARGATPQEIAEAMEVLYSVSGLRPLLSSLKAYKAALEVNE
jgi:alkylhydroperoxidase/carboxymuconolactone decarboxylase family protein YurZ